MSESDVRGQTPRRWPLAPDITIALLALGASAIGIVNWFTYDDRYIVELNPAVHTMHQWWKLFATSYWPPSWGGDGYRPITLLAFAAEWSLGRGTAMTHHAANILLYLAVSVAVFRLARRLLPLWAAWTTAALFAVHPVHVEAVANIVGQSELWVAVFTIPAVVLYLRARQAGPLRLRTAASIALLYALACFSKEHGIVLPALLIAAEVLLVADPRPTRTRFLELRPFYLVLAGIGLTFVGVRSLVLIDAGVAGFRPFIAFQALKLGHLDRVLTMFGVVPTWLRLFYWPARLSSEYAPPAVDIAQGFSLVQVPGFLLLASILAFAVALRRREPVMSFGIAWVVITLLPSSNFILPAGIILAERTLFLPSVGAMLIVGAGAVRLRAILGTRTQASPGYPSALGNAERRAPSAVFAGVVGLLLIAGVIRSNTRTRVWRENNVLFRQAVIDSPNDYRAHYMLGAWYFEEKNKKAGEAEYQRALNLFPYDPFVVFNMGDQYRVAGYCKPALRLFKLAFTLDPELPLGHTEYAWCLLNAGDYAAAREEALTALRRGGSLRAVRPILISADSALDADHGRRRSSARTTGPTSKVPDSVQKTARRVTPGRSGQ